MNIHAINQFCKRNQTIQKYLKLSHDCSRFDSPEFWKCQKSPLHGTGSMLGTYIYSAAMKELRMYVGTTTSKYLTTVNDTLGTIQYWVHINLEGIKIMIYNPFGGEYIYFYPRSGSLDNTEKIVNDYIEKNLLHPPGLFRDIQSVKLYNKADAILFYKKYMSKAWRRAWYVDQNTIEKSILRYLRKHRNINLVHYSMDIESDFKKALKLGKYKKLTDVDCRPWNITFSDIEEYCYSEGKEVDEDTIEEAFYELTN